jgi:predicted Zn-dependent peptidase
VDKEQGIIGQEIKMYDDSADWRLMFALYQCLYQEHPLRDDIAGSVESIAQITPELLYACTDAFYRPQNMALAVAGNVTMEQVLAAVERANLQPVSGEVEKKMPHEPQAVATPRREFTMAVSKPVLGLGFKEAVPAEDEALKMELICDMLTELVCGSITPLYRKLYDEALVSPGFSGELLSVPGALCLMFGGEVSDPELVRDLLLHEIERLRTEGVDEAMFTLCKNQMYGELVQCLDNIEDVAGGLFGAFNRGRTPSQEIETLAALTVQDVNDALQNLLLPQHSATVVIYPAQDDVKE